MRRLDRQTFALPTDRPTDGRSQLLRSVGAPKKYFFIGVTDLRIVASSVRFPEEKIVSVGLSQSDNLFIRCHAIVGSTYSLKVLIWIWFPIRR